MPTVCWLLAGLPPLLVVLCAAVLLLFNWWRFRDVSAYMDLHQRLLENLRKAVDAYGKDGVGPQADELWRGDGRKTLDYIARVFEEAAQFEDRARELATLDRSQEWRRFWQDLEAVTKYACRVVFRRALETWAGAAVSFCPRSLTLVAPGEGTKTWRDEVEYGLAFALCDIYEALAQGEESEGVPELVRTKTQEQLDLLVNKVAPNPSERKAAEAWQRASAEALAHVLTFDEARSRGHLV